MYELKPCSDVRLISQLGFELQDFHRKLVPDAWIDRQLEPYTKENHEEVWVAWDSDYPIGYVLVTYRDKEFIVENLYVRPAYRGLGIGTQLLDKAHEIAYSLNFGTMIIRAYVDNVRAIRLYERLGFVRRVVQLTKDI